MKVAALVIDTFNFHKYDSIYFSLGFEVPLGSFIFLTYIPCHSRLKGLKQFSPQLVVSLFCFVSRMDDRLRAPKHKVHNDAKVAGN
jgi:hypothetical protein